MSGDEEIVSKRARKNYPGEVSFGALSKEENEHSVAQVSRCTDTGNCTWTEDGTKPQLLGGLGEEGGGGSSLQQMVEEEFGELSFLLGEPQACHDFSSTPASANNASEKVAAVTGSYYNDPMNVRYFDKVWGEEVHVGRYDLLEGDDAKLEGLERVQRATAMTNNVLMDRLFPASFVPSGETAVMDMGSGFGTFARSIATRFGCKVVCIDMSSTFNAINATRSEEAGLAEKIIIPGERSFFDTRVPSSSMSGLVSMDSFMHTNGDTDMIMKESARVLRRGSLMVFTDIMQSNTADATAMQKVYDEYGIEKFCSPETLENSGKDHGMKLVGFEDRTPNLRIHYQTLIDLIASLRSKLENVDDSMLDARSSRSSKIVEAEQGGHMSWGTFVFRKDVD